MEGTVVYLLGALLYSFVQQGLAVQCYVCSWSPEDYNNRTNFCTEENFQSINVFTHECSIGCETYIQWDINGDLEHWRRNCIQPGVDVNSNCEPEENVGWKWKRCPCYTDLCNSAFSRTYCSVLLWLVVILAGYSGWKLLK